MRRFTNIAAVLAVVLGFMVLTAPDAAAQKLAKALEIQAQAMGQSTQLGQTFNITLHIEELSTPEEQQGLIEAFNQKKNEGLVNALQKMKSKGRMAITGTLGYDVSYIRKFPMPDGTTKYRLVTNRPITFGELWSDSRSSDYSLSGVEIILDPADKKKNSGTLAPLCQLKLNKEGHIELELFQNPWKLIDVQLR